VFASEWKRAAIVRAFAESRQGKRSDLSDSSEKLTLAQFAKLGIVGLKDKDSVARYYRAWDLTGLPTPEPGGMVTLPPMELEFPSAFQQVTGWPLGR
jgi:hypothetical protein